jgi:hypothetical protein
MSAEKKPKSKSAKNTRDSVSQSEQPKLGATDSRLDETRWHEQAAFHITFNHATDTNGQTIWQTHTLREETGDEHVWAGIPGADMIAWMRDRAGLPADVPAPCAEPAAETLDTAEVAAPAAAPSSDFGSDLRLRIGGLEVQEIPVEQQVGGSEVKGCMRSHVSFDLEGTSAYFATSNAARYAIQVLACNLTTDQAVVLAASQAELRPELLSYTEILDFNLPPLGSYQLLATVVLADNGVAEVALGPVLTVVP